VVFDTYNYVKRLKAVGMPEAQAEVQAEAIATLVDENLVTRQHFDARMRELELTFERRIAEVKADLIKWVLGISAAQAALLVTLLRLTKRGGVAGTFRRLAGCPLPAWCTQGQALASGHDENVASAWVYPRSGHPSQQCLFPLASGRKPTGRGFGRKAYWWLPRSRRSRISASRRKASIIRLFRTAAVLVLLAAAAGAGIVAADFDAVRF